MPVRFTGTEPMDASREISRVSPPDVMASDFTTAEDEDAIANFIPHAPRAVSIDLQIPYKLTEPFYLEESERKALREAKIPDPNLNKHFAPFDSLDSQGHDAFEDFEENKWAPIDCSFSEHNSNDPELFQAPPPDMEEDTRSPTIDFIPRRSTRTKKPTGRYSLASQVRVVEHMDPTTWRPEDDNQALAFQAKQLLHSEPAILEQTQHHSFLNQSPFNKFDACPQFTKKLGAEHFRTNFLV
jgi:hypothetical protein